MTIFTLLFFSVGYTALIMLVAQFAPNKGRGETLTINNRVVGYKLEGQLFSQDKYFNGRPSAVNYNGAGSGGSNKGPSNPEYLQLVKDRIDSFRVHNAGIPLAQIPAELVTASGSGLDPDISPKAATVQVPRIAKLRNLDEATLNSLIKSSTEKAFFSRPTVNVLAINIELDKLQNR